MISQNGVAYSGFHQGAGETTIAELLEADVPKYSLLLIDEVESSLHPRAQRRLIRDLAEKCRVLELQIILTTHSPYILEELPSEARACILQTGGKREIVYGVSPSFAMSKMDDIAHYECDIYVEDDRAKHMVIEILVAHDRELVSRCQLVPYGAASVGQSLGQMAERNRFPRPSCVFLDGDRGPAPGCKVLPGEDAPERVVFEALQSAGWTGLAPRVGRDFAEVADACNAAMQLADHHDWVRHAANRLVVAGDDLWRSMCAEWAANLLPKADALAVAQAVRDTLQGIQQSAPDLGKASGANMPDTSSQTRTSDSPNDAPPLFELSVTAVPASMPQPAPDRP